MRKCIFSEWLIGNWLIGDGLNLDEISNTKKALNTNYQTNSKKHD